MEPQTAGWIFQGVTLLWLVWLVVAAVFAVRDARTAPQPGSPKWGIRNRGARQILYAGFALLLGILIAEVARRLGGCLGGLVSPSRCSAAPDWVGYLAHPATFFWPWLGLLLALPFGVGAAIAESNTRQKLRGVPK